MFIKLYIEIILMKSLKIKAALITLVIQFILATIFFVGGLLDPLLGIGIVLFYFVVINSSLFYKVILHKLQ